MFQAAHVSEDDEKDDEEMNIMDQTKKSITFIAFTFMISALVLHSLLAPSALAQAGITITRSTADAVAPGSTFEVRLSVDVPDADKPRTYILVENIPKSFTIVDTDSKMRSDETGQMKWIVVEGLFGAKVEDATYVYHLRAPDTIGAYTFNGSAMLEDKKSVATSGAAAIEVSESARNTDTSSGSPIGFGIVPYMILAILVIALISLKLRSKTNGSFGPINGSAAATSTASLSPDKKGRKARTVKVKSQKKV